MDGVALLSQARDAGIEVKAVGEQLHVRGPKRHEALVKQLFEYKPELLDLLRDEPVAIKWRAESDLDAFITAHCLTQSDLTERGTDLYRAHRHWCASQGKRILSLQQFEQALLRAGFRREVIDGRAHYFGIALNAPPESESPPATMAVCSGCDGTDWGASGRHAEDGAEIWCCMSCAVRRDAP